MLETWGVFRSSGGNSRGMFQRSEGYNEVFSGVVRVQWRCSGTVGVFRDSGGYGSGVFSSSVGLQWRVAQEKWEVLCGLFRSNWKYSGR